jgi:hypothetical protein
MIVLSSLGIAERGEVKAQAASHHVPCRAGRSIFEHLLSTAMMPAVPRGCRTSRGESAVKKRVKASDGLKQGKC